MNAAKALQSVVIVGKVLALALILFALLAVSNVLLGVDAGVEQSRDTAERASGEPPAMSTPRRGPTSSMGAAGSPQGPPSAEESAAAQARLALAVLGVCLLQTIAVAAIVLPSSFHGWRLALAVFLVAFGMSVVLTQMESVVFLEQMGIGLIGRIVAAGAVCWALFSPVAVWLLGRGRRRLDDVSERSYLSTSVRDWMAVVVALGVLHMVLYFVFGYYLAWRVPELARFYGGEDPGSFWAQLVLTARFRAWFFPFQFFRGVLWGLLAVVIAVMAAGSRLRAVLAATVVFAILVPSQLLIPNPYMPDAVRMTHFVETLLSRSLFGFLAAWLLTATVLRPAFAPTAGGSSWPESPPSGKDPEDRSDQRRASAASSSATISA